jgi:FKBP-type peptidyl-prolyl cis-trans isomerase 2
MLRSRSFVLLFIIILILSGCERSSRFKGYSVTRTGLYYKLVSIGDGGKRPTFGDWLKLRISYRTENDSLFLDTRTGNDLGAVFLPFNHSSFEGSFEEGLADMNEGDSVSFMVAAEPLFSRFFHMPLPFFLKSQSMVRVDVKLLGILNQDQYRSELDHLNQLIEDRDIEEQRRLMAFVDSCDLSFVPMENGMFFCLLTTGKGSFPERGQSVQIRYNSHFLDGRLAEQPGAGSVFEFTLGEQGQVLPGLESAIYLMQQGSKAKFIIPSQLAFGATGSSNGSIPPYSSLLYEVELLTINK